MNANMLTYISKLTQIAALTCVLAGACASTALGISIPANPQWSYVTPFSISAGSLVDVTASGTWTSGNFTGGPEGMNAIATPGYILVGVNAYSLIGQIGSGTPFFIGTSYSGIANATGPLRLGMNDVPGIFWDNSGAVDATIGVSQAPDSSSTLGLLGLSAVALFLWRRFALV